MDNNLEKLMQKNIVKEDVNLSKMIEDIVPKTEQLYTNRELEVSKKESFSLVVYKKRTILTRIVRAISISLEKFKIIKDLRNFELDQNKR